MSRRNKLARGIDRLLAAEEARPRLSAAIPPQREQVRDAGETLAAIAHALRAPRPVGEGGLALVTRLLADGASPAYAPAPPGALAALADDALAGLYEISTPRGRISTRP